MKRPILYKVLGEDGRSCHGGNAQWPLPVGKRAGKWMPKIENIKACERGYHLATKSQLIEWLGPRIFVAEARGEQINAGDKIVVEQARLLHEIKDVPRPLRLFACDCAERALEVAKVNDERSWNAIKVSRRFANSEATAEELAAARAAAWDAAGAAARAAARAAAWDAARAAAGDAAWAAAWDAAWDAAGAAAWDAARAAAGAAERKWQSKRLAKYLGIK